MVLLGPVPAAADTPATGFIITVSGSSLVDGETFTVSDGINPSTTFEFDSNGSVSAGQVGITFTAGQNATNIRDAIINAVNSAGASLAVTAWDGGAARVNLTNDNGGAVGNLPLTETVTNPSFTVDGMAGGNSTPVLGSIGDKTVDEGTQLQFTLTGTDPDGDPLTYSASSLPPGATFDSATQTFTWTPSFAQAGIYANVRFEVSDGSLLDFEELTISVTNVDRAPVLTPIGNKAVSEGTQFQLTVSATDPDGDPVTYSASSLPPGATFDSATQTFTWTPGYSQAGTYPGIRFTVSDGTLTDFEDITVTVSNVVRTTKTSLSVKKTRRRITASGAVTPTPQRGKVIVSLYRKRGGKFRRLDTNRPSLSATSKYQTRFSRPRAGRCRIIARFPGSTEGTQSSIKKTFRC